MVQNNFTGQLSALAQKRIPRERQRLEQETKELQDCGIFTLWTDELHKVVALIVGPEGTPYEHGFYFFDIQFPDDYPIQPPRVVFKTGDGRVRLNPNLYVDGKVCLSLLGTWSGPSWTTSCNLRTVLVSIQSLLNEHPIRNEPGCENESGEKDQLYTEIIRYENIAVGVLKMLKQTPPKFRGFRGQMRQIFLEHVGAHLQTLQAYEDKEGTVTRSPIWNFKVHYHARELAAKVKELQAELLIEESGNQSDAAASATSSVASAAVRHHEESPRKRQRLGAL